MDCCSVESEFIESLDFLSPPVKRLHNSREAFGRAVHNEGNNVHLLRGLRNKFARRAPSSTRNTRTAKTNGESSTSLVLKKTSERQILEQYSIVSYTSLKQPEEVFPSERKFDKYANTVEKPLIKVTVIPKTDQVQTAKILRKRRYIPKRVSSTTSNQENSVQTKNVYLIVAGRRRDKIYEIKTTGSATFSTDHDSYTKNDELAVKELSNFKHLIQSLNMDRKKKKERKAQAVNLDTPQQTTNSTTYKWKRDYPECEDCMYNESKYESKMPQKSRVRIFGQFGISENDKYVLRYGATVNDKQVLSDVAQLTRDFSPVMVPMAPYGTYCDGDPECQKDFCIQAGCDNQFDIEKLAVTDKVPSMESQGTQVNFNVQIASMSREKSSKHSDKKIQCSCCTITNTSDQKGLKDCESPLVIISVYPKQSPEDVTKSIPSPSQNMRCPTPPRVNTYTSNQVLKIDKGTKRSKIETRKNYKSFPSPSRSPSPTKKTSRIKMQENKLIETKLMKTQVTEKRSPDRQKALRAIKEKIEEKDKLKRDAGTRQSSKFITPNVIQISKNLQNLTVSNATQVSNKNKNVTSSNGTQVSARNPKNYTVSNATQYSTNPLNFFTSNATQCGNCPQNIIAPIKHSKNVIMPMNRLHNNIAPIKHTQNSHMSNATQVPNIPFHYVTNNATQYVTSNATQVSNNGPFTVSNATQVSKNQQNFIASRTSKNQQTFTFSTTNLVFKNEQTSKTQESGTNTEHARAKKALVETYTRKLTEQMNQKDLIPTKFGTSKVTINIDGGKEYYDVLFNQDKLSTDLTIRKTLKDIGSQKYEDDPYSASFENLLVLPCKETERGVIPENQSPAKSTSISLYNNPPNYESPLTKHVSRLTIRDSIEISHRREDKSNPTNMKNTQTCFTAHIAEKIPDETEFLAPIKHYTGDDCSICDPIERDKQIRELLGVGKTKLTYSTQQVHNSENVDRFPYQCIYRQECKKSQVTEINFQFQKLCPCLKPPNHGKGKSGQLTSVSVQCQHTSCHPKTRYDHNNYNYDEEEQIFYNEDENETYGPDEKCFISPFIYGDNERNHTNGNYSNDQNGNNDNYHISEKYPNYDSYNNDESNHNDNNNAENEDGKNYVSKEESAFYQQLILNRNIQIFLEVEQFSKQKPIVLSRKQYNKVKKTIQKTISKQKSSHDKRKKIVCRKCERSEVSVGEVRKKSGKDTKLLLDKEAQTDQVPCSRDNCRNGAYKFASKLKSRQMKSLPKPISTDLSYDLSVDHSDDHSEDLSDDHSDDHIDDHSDDHSDEPVIEVPRKSNRLSELSNQRRKTRSRKSRRSSDRYVKNKSTRKLDQNIEVVTIDQFNGNVSRFSERSGKLNTHLNGELNAVQVGERIRELTKERYAERFNKCEAECNAERYSERKGDRCSERQSGQKGDRSSEWLAKERGVRGFDQYNEQKGANSTDRYTEQKGKCSPEQYSDQNEEQNRDGAIKRKETEVKTLILFNADDTKGKSKNTQYSEKESPTRKTLSSVEIRYASVAYMKQVAYSSTDVGAISDSSLAHANSFHTIFRGHRKSPTPNLGTSAYSLYSEDGFHSENKSAKFIMEPRDSKPKKPFLRRLMSCLVMRSTRDSELKLPTGPAPEPPSVNSSIDSYHISTSLGAVEVSSSIYDTSASFYSNHTILPVNSKIKRGFFSSVRGFLTNRKS